MRRCVVAVIVLSVVACGGGGSATPTAPKLRYAQFEGTVQRVEDATPFDLQVLCDNTSFSGPVSCENGVCLVASRTELIPSGQHTMEWKITRHTDAAKYTVNGEILILLLDGGLIESITVHEEERLTEGDSIRKTFSF